MMHVERLSLQINGEFVIATLRAVLAHFMLRGIDAVLDGKSILLWDENFGACKKVTRKSAVLITPRSLEIVYDSVRQIEDVVL